MRLALALKLDAWVWGFDLETLRLGVRVVVVAISGCEHSCFSLNRSFRCHHPILETPLEGIAVATGYVEPLSA
jgi:hypothetical protein